MPDFAATEPIYIKDGKLSRAKDAMLLAPVGAIVTEADQRKYGIPHPDKLEPAEPVSAPAPETAAIATSGKARGTGGGRAVEGKGRR